jgi:cytochrome c oxidase assembly protein subunit 15
MTAMNAITLSPARAGRPVVGIWLLGVAALIALMVIVGGLTRLTGSGLSITEWRPVTGAIPPLSGADWASEFAKYQRIPQFRLENPSMTLDGFRTIFWWEWSHRFLGRLLGFAFLLPFLYFVATGAIRRPDMPRMILLFLLGALQGFVGWWMVSSGLETRVSVSQYRLAIHLGVAIILLGAMIWIGLDYLRGSRRVPQKPGKLAPSAFAFVGLVYFQILLGALVAGLHAGLIYNTWPSMNGHVLPETPFFSHPWWTNFGENAGLAQFDHRLGAYAVALAALVLWNSSRSQGRSIRTAGRALLSVTASQVMLGIFTLLYQAPIVLAALHQLTAVALFATAVWFAFEARYENAYEAVSA